MSNPKVSIITVNFNTQKHLEQTIQSVLSQSYKNIEYIIIDGGSTDGSLDIIKKYEKNVHYWVSEPDNGISSAFNKGIRSSTGEIIGLINSDDWYQPDAVEKAVRFFQQVPDADVVCGGLQNWENNQKEVYIAPSADLSGLRYEMLLNHPACFIKKSAYEKYGIYDETYYYAMDYELFLKFYLHSAKFVCVDEWMANMRLGGVSGKYWSRAYQEMLRSQLTHLDSKTTAYINYFCKILRTGTRIGLKKLGLNWVVVAYRSLQKRKRYFNGRGTNVHA